MIRTSSLLTCLAPITAVSVTVAVTMFDGSAARAAAPPTVEACHARVNDTPAKLGECIQLPALWHHLAVFQHIADANPGPDGHGNRDSGTSGYRQSVNYVVWAMRRAGYDVTIQRYPLDIPVMTGTPSVTDAQRSYQEGRDWSLARLSGGGAVAAPVQPAGGTGQGCDAGEFSGFVAGRIALLRRGACDADTQVRNAVTAGAAAVILSNVDSNVDGHVENNATAENAAGTSVDVLQNGKGRHGGAADGRSREARLGRRAQIPVIGYATRAMGEALRQRYAAGLAPTMSINVPLRTKRVDDFNVIAESRYGDPNRTLVVDAHLDSIYGAGILDNASGSATILEVALNLAHTPTKNRLRYVWFGGEELGLFGSAWYTTHLSAPELAKIAFNLDVDVTATPNFDILIADAGHAPNVRDFPPNVVPQSRIGNAAFTDYFSRGGVISRLADFGNDGTDSNSFSLVGVPNTGILTQQDCCKLAWEVKLWGGFLGNYEGKVPGTDGGCVDNPRRWCDNLSNNDPFVMQLASAATADAIFRLANASLPVRAQQVSAEPSTR